MGLVTNLKEGGAPVNLAAKFLDVADAHASKVALWDGDEPVTYAALRYSVDACRHHILPTAGADRVGLLLPTGSAFVAAYFGTQLAGKTPVPISYYLSAGDIAHIVADAGLDTVVTCRPLAGQLQDVDVSTLLVEEIGPASSRPIHAANGWGTALATLLYTSGSEGTPKGVTLSSVNLSANLRGCVDAIGFDESFVVLGTLPLFHSFALTTTMLLPLLHGATAVYPGRFEPGKVLDAIARRRVTAMMSIPSLYKALLARAPESPEADLSSLTHAISGGEPLPPAVAEAFERRFGKEILNGYGLTETSPVVSVNRLGENRPESVGRPLCNVQVKIVDPATCQELPPGESGEICVEGLSVTEGYYRRPDLTRAAFLPDRYLRTGDVGRLDADGYLHVTGRLTDMMIIAGENVFPREIEDVIQTHEDVLECAVVGVPDAVRGEAPKAFVAPIEGRTLSVQDVKDHCRRSLPAHKIPRKVELIGELPKSPTGKVARRFLK